MSVQRLGRRRAGFVGLLLLALTACGVPIENSAAPIPEGALASLPTLSASTSSAREALLWFVRDNGLVAVKLELAEPPTATGILQALATSPPTQVAGRGLRTIAGDPLTGTPLVTVSPPVDGENASGAPRTESVSVQITSAFTALPGTEQMLLLGQVVLSLTSAGWPSVTMTDESGATVAVPLPNGRLLDRPALARDYTSLELTANHS